MDRRSLGTYGEEAVARHLEASGCAIIGRRHRTRFGEIDLIAKDGGEIVFIEVKTRRGSACGDPEESVHARKRAHLRAAACAFLAARGLEDAPFRIDVVTVLFPPDGGTPLLRHIRSAVGEDD
jgi:putative endonuclease